MVGEVGLSCFDWLVEAVEVQAAHWWDSSLVGWAVHSVAVGEGREQACFVREVAVVEEEVQRREMPRGMRFAQLVPRVMSAGGRLFEEAAVEELEGPRAQAYHIDKDHIHHHRVHSRLFVV